MSDGPSVPKFGKGPDNYIPSIFSSEAPPESINDKRRSRLSSSSNEMNRRSSVFVNGRRSSMSNKRISQLSPNTVLYYILLIIYK